MDSNKKFLASSVNLIVIFGILIGLIYFMSTDQQQKGLSLHFLSVGQGDSELIQAQFGGTVLIDGGPDSTVVTALDRYIPFYRRKIDAVILTHPHADHVNGLVDVLEKYQIGHVYLTGVVHTAPEYIKFLQLVKEKNIAATDVSAGDRLEIGDGAVLKILFPLTKLVGEKVDSLNNTSIVARLEYGKESALFTGDIENEGQQSIFTTGVNLKSDILKVPHHGSKYATTDDLLRRVSPKYAVIEVGKKNQYGHPHAAALSLLKSYGVQIFRTDLDGDVNMLMTKNSIKIHN